MVDSDGRFCVIPTSRFKNRIVTSRFGRTSPSHLVHALPGRPAAVLSFHLTALQEVE